MRAILLIAHGSRRKEANQDLEHVAEIMRRDESYAFVQCSYLELTEPTIIQGRKPSRPE